MTNPPPRYAPFVVAAIVLVSVLGAEMYNASKCDGYWAFALDDSYIHLAMARNLAEHGIWGATPDSFSATSSAPLYTLLLAGAFLTGLQSEAWAWIFSLSGGLIAAFLLTRRIQESFPRNSTAIAIGLAAAVVTWLPEIMTTGLEHTLHMSAVLVVMLLLERLLSESPGDRTPIWFLVAIFVAGGLRYETLFLLPPITWVLWQGGRRKLAWAALAAGALPAIILGIIYSSHGAMFFPNSVLLKGSELDRGMMGHVSRLLRQLDEPSRFLLLAIAVLNIIELVRRTEKHRLGSLAASLVYIVVLIVHTALARPDRRYLGYIMAIGVWATIPPLSRWYALAKTWLGTNNTAQPRRWTRLALACLIALLMIPFLKQILDVERLPKLGHDIYAQQYQMARFLSTYYPGQCVGLNDIGTTAWAGKNRILDYWGLADNEVARLRLDGQLNPESMARLARERDVKVVVIYSHWFKRAKGLPADWQMVGVWHTPIELHVNAASNTVDFYATTPDAVEPLRRNLQAFKAQLPADVTVIM